MTRPLHDSPVTLRMQIYRMQEEVADLRVKLAATQDHLEEAREEVNYWRDLYHSTIDLPDTEVLDDGSDLN